MNARARYHAMALTMALIAPALMLRRPIKPNVQCRLPGCTKFANHNKGYCSAACFKASKKVLDV